MSRNHDPITVDILTNIVLATLETYCKSYAIMNTYDGSKWDCVASGRLGQDVAA